MHHKNFQDALLVISQKLSSAAVLPFDSGIACRRLLWRGKTTQGKRRWGNIKNILLKLPAITTVTVNGEVEIVPNEIVDNCVIKVGDCMTCVCVNSSFGEIQVMYVVLLCCDKTRRNDLRNFTIVLSKTSLRPKFYQSLHLSLNYFIT